MGKIQHDKDISSFSAFKTSAVAKYFFEIRSLEDIPELLLEYSSCKSQNLPILVLGAGTNCLFAFDYFPGLVISVDIKGIEMLEKNRVYFGAAELVSPLSIQFTKENLTNALIPWIGLPGTIGGAIVGNAGCFGLETKDILLSVKVVNLDTGDFLTLPSSDLIYGYRDSNLKKERNLIVLGGLFDFSNRDENPYSHKSVIEMLAIRREKQPAGLSCGSFYANPLGASAGKLIDEAGCKGYKIGGAKISELHGNFFLVDSTVRYQDILELSEYVKMKVFKKSGIQLHEEVRIIYTNS